VYLLTGCSNARPKSGLVARIHDINPEISWQHCIIQKQSLMAEKITPDSNETLKVSI
jgi:hypothetical protein